jgi:outer membrane protein assembly factor BamE
MGYHASSLKHPCVKSKTMRRLLWLVLLVTALLSGCIVVYKTDTQQGNLVTQEMLDKLKPGMTRAQVRYVLGTPLIRDIFHPDRWDYYYYFKKGGAVSAQTRRITVIFDNDVLKRIEGDTVARKNLAAPATTGPTPPVADGNPVPAPDPAQSRAL